MEILRSGKEVGRSASGSDVKEEAKMLSHKANRSNLLEMTQIDGYSEKTAKSSSGKKSLKTTPQLITAIDGSEKSAKKSVMQMKKSAMTAIGSEEPTNGHKQRQIPEVVGTRSLVINGMKTPLVTFGRTNKLEEPEGHITRPLIFATACVSLASFQFGYSIGCVNEPSGLVTEWIIASHHRMFNAVMDKATAELTWSMVVSIFGVGAMLGAISSSSLADKAGRRGGLFYTNIIAFLAAALMGLAKVVDIYPMLLFGRFFIGIYVGLTVMVPMYLTEISSTNHRGTFGLVHQLLITLSILFSQLLGLPQFFGTPDRWPYIFAFVAVPALLQVIALPMIPESPKFTLCIRDEVERATQDLELLRGTDNVHAEVELLRAEARKTKDDVYDIPSMLDMFRGSLLWPSTLTILMMAMQQLTGINAAIFYSTMLFKKSGLTEKESVYATFGMGIVNVLMTIVANLLIDHPKCGRRMLLLSGIVGMLISSLLLIASISVSMTGNIWASYASVAFILLFVMSFAVGPGPIPWFLPSEIFFTNARANACALASLSNWTMNVIVSFTFVPINNAIHQFSFLVFFFFLTLFFAFIWKYVPETNGKTIEEIVAEFKLKSNSGRPLIFTS